MKNIIEYELYESLDKNKLVKIRDQYYEKDITIFKINNHTSLKSNRSSKYQEIPNDVFKLVKLKELDFSKEDLVIISDDIEKLKNLYSLNLSYNRHLSILPKTLNKLNKLHVLNLLGCNFSKIPLSLLKSKSLNTLNISHNNNINDKEFNKIINNLPELEYLNINHNTNITEIPDNISKLKKLKQFYFLSIENLKYISPKLITDTKITLHYLNSLFKNEQLFFDVNSEVYFKLLDELIEINYITINHVLYDEHLKDLKVPEFFYEKYKTHYVLKNLN